MNVREFKSLLRTMSSFCMRPKRMYTRELVEEEQGACVGVDV
jgi:hypothetical protein